MLACSLSRSLALSLSLSLSGTSISVNFILLLQITIDNSWTVNDFRIFLVLKGLLAQCRSHMQPTTPTSY